MATRTNRNTSTPIASIMRRIWRFLPSSRTISSQQFFCPARRRRACFARSTCSVFRFHSSNQRLNKLFIRDRSHLHMVGLVQMRFRRGDARSPLGIVGQQQQALAGLIQTADGGDPRRSCVAHRTFYRRTDCSACVHRLAALFVRCRRHHAARLVQHEVDFLARSTSFAIDRNLSCFPETGVSGSRRTFPFKLTRPARINSAARDREQ